MITIFDEPALADVSLRHKRNDDAESARDSYARVIADAAVEGRLPNDDLIGLYAESKARAEHTFGVIREALRRSDVRRGAARKAVSA